MSSKRRIDLKIRPPKAKFDAESDRLAVAPPKSAEIVEKLISEAEHFSEKSDRALPPCRDFSWEYQWGTVRSGVRTVRRRSSDGPGEATAPPGPPPLLPPSAIRTANFSTEKIFGRKIQNFSGRKTFWPKIFRPKKKNLPKNFRPNLFLVEHFLG